MLYQGFGIIFEVFANILVYDLGLEIRCPCVFVFRMVNGQAPLPIKKTEPTLLGKVWF